MGMIPILVDKIAAFDGAAFSAGAQGKPRRSFVAKLAGTGALTATINIEVSHDGLKWVDAPAIIFTITGNDEIILGGTLEAPWPFYRACLTAITGTGATANVTMAD